MADNGAGRERRSPCSIGREPFPELQQCPGCGSEQEVWSDEDDAVCTVCGHAVSVRMDSSTAP